jgi:hypothetical protein
VWNEWGFLQGGSLAARDLPMPRKTPERSKKRATKPRASDAAAHPETAAADRYIAGQLKAIYDAVAAEPIPDRLLQLLDRLGGDGKD